MFEHLLSIEWVGSLAQFVRNVAGNEIEYPGQNGRNWKLRGVPAKFALRAAHILECEPEDISAIEASESIRKAIPDLPPLHAALLDDIEDFDNAQMVAMIRAAGHIRDGHRLVPEIERKTSKPVDGRAAKVEPDSTENAT